MEHGQLWSWSEHGQNMVRTRSKQGQHKKVREQWQTRVDHVPNMKHGQLWTWSEHGQNKVNITWSKNGVDHVPNMVDHVLTMEHCHQFGGAERPWSGSCLMRNSANSSSSSSSTVKILHCHTSEGKTDIDLTSYSLHLTELGKNSWITQGRHINLSLNVTSNSTQAACYVTYRIRLIKRTVLNKRTPPPPPPFFADLGGPASAKDHLLMLNFYCFSRTRRYIDGDRSCHLSAISCCST